MNEQDAGGRGESRASIISSVRTPLGFFVLVMLVVEAILGVVVGLSAGEDRTLAIKGMLIIIVALILVVAFMAVLRPGSLVNQPASPDAGRSLSMAPNQKTNIAGTYHAGADYKYKVIITRLTGDYYRVFNPEDWEGVGFFDGEFYHGVFKFNEKAHPPDRRGNWGAHRARLHGDGFELFGIELKGKEKFDEFDKDGWVKENAGE
jgi:hypothetical protein